MGHKFPAEHAARLESPERLALLPIDRVVELAGARPGQRILDIGCGTGVFTIPFARAVGMGGRVLAADILPEMVDACRRRAAAEGLANVEVVLSTENAVPYPAASADLVFACQLLHELHEPPLFFAEMRRLLAPDGRLVVVDWEKVETGIGPPVAKRLTPDEARVLLLANGFHVERRESVSRANYLLAARDARARADSPSMSERPYRSRGSIPTMELFAAPRPSLGDRAVRIDLAGLVVRLEGLDAALASALRERYAPYADEADAGPDDLRVTLRHDAREYFIDPPDVPEENPVLLACDGTRVRYAGYRLAGWFDTRGGRGEMLLASGGYEPPVRAIENYVRSAVAWQAAERGGALVHAASAVLDGKGYLFYGPSGAGKSTLSSCNTRATILSDDLSLVLPRADGGLDVAGSPFRGTYTGGPAVRGRFPLAAGFRIVQAPGAEVRTVARVRVLAELIANLPFVDDAFSVRPDLFERFERTFGSLTLRHLHFRKDESYWDAIAVAGL